jgi:hypothetical protein
VLRIYEPKRGKQWEAGEEGKDIKLCHVARLGDMIYAYKILVEEPEGKTRRRWEGNIRMDRRKMGGGLWMDATGSG